MLESLYIIIEKNLREFKRIEKIGKKVYFMNEIILSANMLPEPLLGLLDADGARAGKSDDSVIMTPVRSKYDYIEKLYGSCAGGVLTVDKFLEWTREDQEIKE